MAQTIQEAGFSIYDSATHLPSRKPRLLALGQFANSTGYARVFASILTRIAERFEAIHFGVNYDGPVLQREYKILPNLLLGDYFGKKQLPSLLDQLQPDIIFLYHDLQFYLVHKPVLDRYKEQHPEASVVIYCPVEWEDTPPGNFSHLVGADRLVFFTEFGRDVFLRALQFTGIQHLLRHAPAVIPHGVDTSRFFPLVSDDLCASRLSARGILFPDRPELAGAFIVLNANRNSLRKRIEITLEIFAEFARSKPDAYLYLHVGMLDRGCDVLDVARRLDIESRLLLTTRDAAKPNIPDEHLNWIYNACDVGMNTSTGEGWGLVAFEHAAAGAPQILPAHSACLELWADRGILLPVKSANGHLDTAHAIQQLNLLYSHRALLLEGSARALDYAREPKFSWDQIAHQWADLFAACVHSIQR
jgi:D-inositol-3-phosphate glycosyltransferase